MVFQKLNSKKGYIDDVMARSRDHLEMNLSTFSESPKDYLEGLMLKSHLSLLLLSHLHAKVVMVFEVKASGICLSGYPYDRSLYLYSQNPSGAPARKQFFHRGGRLVSIR